MDLKAHPRFGFCIIDIFWAKETIFESQSKFKSLSFAKHGNWWLIMWWKSWCDTPEMLQELMPTEMMKKENLGDTNDDDNRVVHSVWCHLTDENSI